jgi:prepilin-type N-terminal cleavage/methylation domain-containing protein/prepilin-type processing-associated H-X9-DG protein
MSDFSHGDFPPPGPGRRPCAKLGFTLIELLAAVAILGVLGALLLPAASAARSHGRKAAEISAARQLIIAYHAAAEDRRGVLLAGSAAGRSARAESGAAVDNITASRWPHHLRPYLGDRFRVTLYLHEQAAYYDRHQADDYALSLAPSFGLNARFVGGDGSPLLDRPVTRLEQAGAPNRLLAFASTRARELAPDAGYWTATAPTYWTSLAIPDYDDPRPASDRAHGHIAARWGGRATVAFLDGSVALLDGSTLRDMRLWSDAARRANDPAYTPPVRP